MTRRQEFARLLPSIVVTEAHGQPVHLSQIYSAIERDHPRLADHEREPSTGALRWRHELRWELESLVGSATVIRRKDLGRGIYSVDRS